MILDVKTLIFCDLAVTAMLGIALLFYRFTQKTYPGYDLWTAGTFALAFGYLSLVLRDRVAPGLGIMATQAAFVAGALLRLDAILRFAKRGKLPPLAYLAGPLHLSASAWFYWGTDSMLARSVLLALFEACVCVLIAVTLLWKPPVRSATWQAMALLHAGYGAVLVWRSALWIRARDIGPFDPAPLHATLFVSIAVLEVGVGLGFFMLTAQRVEQELKALRGLLPICAHCKKIRDDEGHWQQVDVYVKAHSDAEFSHGVCPTCEQKYYGLDDPVGSSHRPGQGRSGKG